MILKWRQALELFRNSLPYVEDAARAEQKSTNQYRPVAPLFEQFTPLINGATQKGNEKSHPDLDVETGHIRSGRSNEALFRNGVQTKSS